MTLEVCFYDLGQIQEKNKSRVPFVPGDGGVPRAISEDLFQLNFHLFSILSFTFLPPPVPNVRHRL